MKLWKPSEKASGGQNWLQLKEYSGAHAADALCCASSHDNSTIASGGADRTVALWDVSTGRIIRKWREHVGVPIHSNCTVLMVLISA